AAGCTSAPSNTVVVVNSPATIASTTATPAAICPGGSSQLQVNLASSAYCTSIAFTSNVEAISNVTFADINNSSACAVGAGAGGALQDFTAVVGNVVAGTVYPMTVTGTTDGNFTTFMTAFFDWDQDGVFEAQQAIGSITNTACVLTATNNVTVPLTARNGTTRMRVVKNFSTSPTNPCGTFGFGQAEDYTLNVTGGDPGPSYSWSPAGDLNNASIANPIATLSTPGSSVVYTVTVTLNGCPATGTATVSVVTVDDGDPCTLDACVNGVVTNTFQDSDSDGICDANDPCPNLANLVNGDPCNDGNVCTINDVVTGCVCAGTFEDTDSDGVCDANDNCPTVPGQLGSACNDGNPLTTGDVLVAGCICQGNLVDCEGTPAGPAVPGSPCTDGDPCTLNDIWSPTCVCAGTFTDTDSDGICDTNDNCPTFPGVQGDPCTDGDPCTINDVITAGCVCAGTPAPVTAGVTASAANYCTPGPGVTLTATGGDTYSWSPATGLSSTTGSPVTATPGTPTTYTVTATNLAGCSDTETIAVGSGAFPATPVMSATPGTVCPGSNSQLVAAIGGAAPSYCTTSYSSGTAFGDYLTSVVIPGTTLNNATGASPTPFYTLYPASGSTTATLTAGTAYTLTAVAGTFTSNDVAAWIDYNKDGVFQAGEKLGEVDNFGATPAVATISFTVPLGALNGTTRMRVREADQTTTGAMSACGALSFGEVEDYDVTIVGGASNCAAGINFSWSPTTFLSDPLICNPVATAVTAATTYTVTATNASGCFSTNTVSVAVETADADGDGTADCADGCPADPNKIAPGQCGCGVADTDTDSDGTADCNDLCPTDPLKIAPGICGCGVADTDTDGDLTADCNDLCPLDPNKTAPGACGCGVADTDGDGDGIADCNDLCPLIAGTVGTPCNDGNAGTINDQITEACVCAGTTPNCAFNTVLLDLTTDGSGSETSWDVVNVGTTTAVCSGSGYLNNQVITLDCCLPDGCYELRVFDSAGDGMANGTVGGYVLRTASGSRIIDNGGDGIFTSTSQVALNLGFCVPLST
ncbi:MAG: thrombospondin type 3 repeat-containing protein, partial [Flavobacteriales bacterium]|nr:thrombospondin type 3 repeat-containing protein [Flavobacteriales bacterium]